MEGTQKRTPEYNSDLIVDELHALGIEYVSLNPGATTRGIHDSIVNYGGNVSPKLILCCHEGVAVSVASGYFRATGKPIAVLLHDIVGLLHASKAIFDAWIDRDGVILIGGNGPSDITRRRPWIDWIHNALIPNTQVREFVKWDDQPTDIMAVLEDLIRAYDISSTEPAGPVYISIDAGLQEEKCESVKLPNPRSYSSPSLEEGSAEAMKTIASSLLECSKPVIVVDKYGRNDEDVANLVNLAEYVGGPVLDTGMIFNFPSNHPLNLTGLESEMLSEADVVLALGTRDLYYHLAKRGEKGFFSRDSNLVVKEGCKIIRIDLEGLVKSSWVSEIGRITPTTMYVSAAPASAVRSILEYCTKNEKKNSSRVNENIASATKLHKKQHDNWIMTAKEAIEKGNKITYPGLALATWKLAREEDWVLAFPGYSSRGLNAWLRRTWDITKRYQYPGRGAGTGTGTGQAIGVSLANPEKLNIDFQPDGDLLYSAGSLWTVANSKIPLLIVMMNNRSYYNDEEHNKFIARERKRSDVSSKIGIRLEDPEVSFSQLASSYGIKSFGRVVEDYENLKSALKEGISRVSEEKLPYLIDVVVDRAL